ncbi:MAG: UPF0179 family protein [Candidatus Thermoplasmatota archaeon]|nr:UPF0179 family protein [Candidatus Thermoplasmatota archaeon]
MVKISLIGTDLSVEGLEFTFLGPLTACSECRIKNACFNLEPGRSYRITKVRDQENPCLIFNKNKVKAVEIEELPEFANIQYGRKLQEGSTVTLKSMNCDYITCKNIEKCNLTNLRSETKATIIGITEKLECPKGYDMRKVEIKF